MGEKLSRYTVPAEIRKLKPTDIPCLWKTIFSSDGNPHYYLYERKRIPDPRRPGKLKNASGACIGKFEGGSLVMNEKGRTLYPDRTIPSISSSATVKLKYQDLQTKDYGEYAAVISASGSVLDRLLKYFEAEDAIRLYAMSVVYFVANYVPAGYFNDIFDQSILSSKWPTLPMSENSVGEFLEILGRHPVACEHYSQSLINDGGELTAIDGHVILSCSSHNDLADYGNKYKLLGGTQVNVVQMYDVENGRPLASCAFDGGINDMTSVKHFFEAYSFQKKTFLVDRGFYSEPNLEMYRKNENHFVIPVPSGKLYDAAVRDLSFSNSFVYEGKDSFGQIRHDAIMYRNYTVGELEKKDYDDRVAEEEHRYAIELKKHEESGCRKPRYRTIKPETYSVFKDDQILVYRDETVHAAMIKEYREKIGVENGYTEEGLKADQESFGVFVLRTDRKQDTAEDVFLKYKKRWSIETHYNYLKNSLDFKGLRTQNYYVMQGLSFISVVVGQIHAAYKKRKQSSSSSYVRNLSIKESLIKAAHLKITQHQDKNWYISINKSKSMELMTEMGVSIEKEMEKLNTGMY